VNPVRIQAFIAKPAVEALRVGILHRLARLNELQPHRAFFAPGGQGSTAKPRPVIQNDGFRQTSLRRHSIQHPPHLQTTQRSIDLNGWAFAGAIVHQRQHTNHFPRTHAITHENPSTSVDSASSPLGW